MLRSTSGRRRVALAAAVAATVTALLVPASSRAIATVGAAEKPAKGGTLNIALGYPDIASLDPVRASIGTQSTGGDRVYLIMSTLLKFNSKTGAIQPGMALSATTDDAQTWTLKLRPNIKFTDGTPYDAEAVIFNFNRFKDPANTFAGIATVAQITSMKAIDAVTVEFKLVQPNGSFGQVFTDITGAMASPTAIKADPRNWAQKPIGAGPFMLKEWVRDQQYTLVRNPDYWDKPRPYIDQIVMKILTDPTVLENTLRQGGVDVIHSATNASRFLKVVNESPKLFKAWNPDTSNGGTAFVCNLDRPPCNDVRFREAVSLSFDLNLARQVFFPDANYTAKQMSCPPMGSASPYCAKDVKVRYNPTRAKKLIDEMKADGVSTDITYTVNRDGANGPGQGEWVQQQLAKVGIKVDLRLITTAEYLVTSTQHNYQASIIYQPPAPDMGTRYYNDWHSVGGQGGGRDTANLNNAKLDVALEKGRNSLKLADRIAGMQEAQRIVAKEFLVMWMYPFVGGNIRAASVHLPSYVSDNAFVWRYDEAWISK